MNTLWARLYKESDPTQPNYPAFDNVEIRWEVAAVNALLAAAFSPDWHCDASALNLASMYKAGSHGLHELQVVNQRRNKLGYVFAKISPWTTLTVKKVKPPHPNYADKVTGALMKDALKTHGKSACQNCGCKDLHMYRLALRCDRCLTHVGGC